MPIGRDRFHFTSFFFIRSGSRCKAGQQGKIAPFNYKLKKDGTPWRGGC